MLEALAALVKFLLYAGLLSGAGAALAAASLGTRLATVRAEAALVMRAGAGLAIVASLATQGILIQRLGGQFDAPTLSAVFEGPTGIAAGLQIVGSLFVALFASGEGLARLVRTLAGVLATASFGVNGHGPAASVVQGLVAFLHVTAAAWWLGSLWLLRPACTRLTLPDLAGLVRAFSRVAQAVVGALVIGGSILVLSLVQFDRQPLLSPYGQILALKLAFAALVLGLAAYNKFRLTPRLIAGEANASGQLRASIVLEMMIIASVLAATAILTTYTSPHA